MEPKQSKKNLGRNPSLEDHSLVEEIHLLTHPKQEQ
jgi:hypothetical protein